MANFNVVAKLSANVKDFQSGMKTAVSSVKDFERTTGSNFERVGKTVSNVGAGLTNAITKPAIIATTAVAGLVTTMGFKRMVGIDNAKAKLTGLGYEAEDIERIMDNLSETLKSGMTTMDEGVNIVAGALAAGVKEGKELDRYVRLVGDAAVGANREVDEMAQIFNRVQGAGKLMTQELNSIEQGMPGFSQAMADHLGVSQQKFREMVTDGKVGTEEFLDVMDDFAGGMAEAFAGTFSGMWGNIKAYIAIIGEALIGGLFEDIKGGMEKVIEVLSSDEAYDWAERTGEKIGEFAREVVDGVKSMIDWWNDLSPVVKDVAKKFGLFMLALGPIMQILGPLISLMSILAPVIAFLVSPVGLVVVAIGALIAVGVLLWKNWDKIKEKAVELGNKVKKSWDNLKTWTSDTWNNMRNTVKDKASEIDKQVATKFSDVSRSVSDNMLESDNVVIEKAGSILSNLTDRFDEAYGETGNTFSAIKKTIGDKLSEIDKDAALKFSNITAVISKELQESDNVVLQKTGAIVENIKTKFDFAYSETGSIFGSMTLMIKEFWTDIYESVREKVTQVYASIIEWFSKIPEETDEIWEYVKTSVSEWVTGMVEKAVELGNNFLESIMEFFDKLPERIGFAIGFVLTAIALWVVDMVMKAYEVGSEFYNNVVGWFEELPGRIEDFLSMIWENVTTWASDMWTKAKEMATNFYNRIIEWFSQLPGRIETYLTNAYNNATTWASDMKTKATEAGREFLNKVIEWIKKLPGRVKEWLDDTISKLTTWVSDMGSKGKEAGQDLVDETVDAVTGLPGKMADAGKEVVKGFWSGIVGLKDWIGGKVSGFFGGIVKGAKSALKIFSPSRIFRDDVGEMVVRGFGVGIERSEKEAMNPMRKMLDNVIGLATGVKGPTIDINGAIARSSAQVRSMVSHEINNGQAKQPIIMHMRVGERQFRAIINDITQQQDSTVDFEETYGF